MITQLTLKGAFALNIIGAALFDKEGNLDKEATRKFLIDKREVDADSFDDVEIVKDQSAKEYAAEAAETSKKLTSTK